ncbi:hypothetical protein N2152v2_001461 [Parachlorella kessleri]
MDFDGLARRSKVTLRGASKQETSRAADLNKAKDERTQRQAAKRQQAGALCIQRAWRRAVARQALRRQLRQQWLAAYGPVVAKPDGRMSPVEVADKVLPPILVAYRQHQGSDASVAAGCCPLPASLCKDTAALRGALALLLRSLGSPKPSDSYLALAVSPGARHSLLKQLPRLAALCCSTLGAPACDPLTQVAATRVVSLLADSSKWAVLEQAGTADSTCLSNTAAAGPAAASAGMLVAEGSSAAEGSIVRKDDNIEAPAAWLARCWLPQLAASPMLVLAARRIAAQLLARAASPGNAGGCGASEASSPAAGASSSQTAGPTPAQLTSMLNSLVTTQLRLWQQQQQGQQHQHCQLLEAARSRQHTKSGGSTTPSQSALDLLTSQVLTLPNLPSILSPAVVASLSQPATFAALLDSAATAGATPISPAAPSISTRAAGSRASSAVHAGLAPSVSLASSVDALWLLTNLTGLLAGKRVRQSTAGASASDVHSKAVEYLPPSPLLQGQGSGGLAMPFVSAAVALLQRATAADASSISVSEALEALWPFTEGSFAVQLLAALPLGLFVHLYHTLLHTMDGLGSTRTAGGKRRGTVPASARVLSALAFATPLLPQLWKWLGVSVGVPLEAPLQATRGWDIPSLSQGIHSVSPEAAEALGLFCRVYNHYLMVTDDYDFHEKQPLFTLGQQRAISATLNTLLFRTHLPASLQHAQHVQQGGSSSSSHRAVPRLSGRHSTSKGMQYSMLEEHAPVLLRAMYERDARRPFCPPALWLQPYQNYHQAAAAQPPSPAPAPTRQSVAESAVHTASSDAGQGGIRRLFRGLTGARDRGQASSNPHRGSHGSDGEVLGLWGAVGPPVELREGTGTGQRHDGDLGPGTDSGSGVNEGQGASGFSAAAVVRALLNSGDAQLQGQAGGAGSPRGPHPHQQHRQLQPLPDVAGLAAASQPSALAAILVAAPQCVPFDERVAVFRALIDMDKDRGRYSLAPIDGGIPPLPMTIRRSHLLEDALSQIPRSGDSLKRRLFVTFVNEQGLQEAGVDMGGLMKELVEQVVQAGFDRNRGLFSATPDGFAYPNPLAERLESGLALLELLGCVLGKALFEGILVDMPLAPFFVSRLQGRWPLFDELSALDPEVYHSLVQLKRYEGNAEDLALDFTVETDALGVRVCEELIPGGSSISVTSANLLQYVYLVADWHLNKRLGVAAAAFGRGLARVIPPSWLRLFSPREVNQLLGGGEGGEIDVADLARYARYSGGYSESSSAVKAFWKVLEGFSQEDRKALLKFVTSCSRAPLGGFRHLNPPLTIHKVDCDAAPLALLGAKDVDRLPSASTCYNMLKLPNYRRSTTLREKLLMAIKSGAGFELS